MKAIIFYIFASLFVLRSPTFAISEIDPSRLKDRMKSDYLTKLCSDMFSEQQVNASPDIYRTEVIAFRHNLSLFCDITTNSVDLGTEAANNNAVTKMWLGVLDILDGVSTQPLSPESIRQIRYIRFLYDGLKQPDDRIRTLSVMYELYRQLDASWLMELTPLSVGPNVITEFWEHLSYYIEEGIKLKHSEVIPFIRDLALMQIPITRPFWDESLRRNLINDHQHPVSAVTPLDSLNSFIVSSVSLNMRDQSELTALCRELLDGFVEDGNKFIRVSYLLRGSQQTNIVQRIGSLIHNGIQQFASTSGDQSINVDINDCLTRLSNSCPTDVAGGLTIAGVKRSLLEHDAFDTNHLCHIILHDAFQDHGFWDAWAEEANNRIVKAQASLNSVMYLFQLAPQTFMLANTGQTACISAWLVRSVPVTETITIEE
jgi:hypothetical protein